MSLIILPASIISICMLVCFPRISHVNPLVSHSLAPFTLAFGCGFSTPIPCLHLSENLLEAQSDHRLTAQVLHSTSYREMSQKATLQD